VFTAERKRDELRLPIDMGDALHSPVPGKAFNDSSRNNLEAVKAADNAVEWKRPSLDEVGEVFGGGADLGTIDEPGTKP